MHTRRIALALALSLALASCGDDDTTASSNGGPTTTTTSTTAVPTTTTTSTTEAPASAPTSIALAPDGFVVTDEDGTTSTLLFGTPRDDAFAVLSDVLGPASDGMALEDCGSGADSEVSFGPSGLLVLMYHDTISGWSVSEGSTLVTAEGIGPGATKDELAAAMGPVDIDEESTLGVEFGYYNSDSTTYIAGFLTDDSPTGVVTELYAGDTCFAR
jgi:hypothetical protein